MVLLSSLSALGLKGTNVCVDILLQGLMVESSTCGSVVQVPETLNDNNVFFHMMSLFYAGCHRMYAFKKVEHFGKCKSGL